ncbi:hypothetical protein [Singulisphaera sp. PoT]|uniref:hypothetical protein n=1 Tax=Singulisphaera sp. PoT TaxID=3411797 RepID=UPI003BF5A4DF
MSMLELACPSCGRGGTIPKQKVNTRLVCKKCRVVFHMTPAERTVLGEPLGDVLKVNPKPVEEERRASASEGIENLADNLTGGLDGFREILKTASPKQLGIAAAVIVVLGIGWTLMNAAPENLTDVTNLAATQFTADDLDSVKAVASSGTAEDVARWYEAVHPRLVKARERWKTNTTHLTVVVMSQDDEKRVGESRAFVYPGPATPAPTTDSSGAASDGSSIQPLELIMHWTLEGSRWRLNGKQTAQTAG